MTFSTIMVAICVLAPGVPKEAECVSSRIDQLKVENGATRAETCNAMFDYFSEGYEKDARVRYNNYKVSCGNETRYFVGE